MLSNSKFKTALLVVLFLAASAAASAQSKETRAHRVIPIKPMTEDVEILYGDPEKQGEPFVMRIRELPGTIIPPHKHPVDEHITVVQGTIYFAVAEKFDRAAMKEIKAGGYAFIPRGSTMFGYIPDGAIVQVHGMGPFHIYWREGASWHMGHKTLDDADAASRFKFRKGERVISKRGTGRIRQAYFSGEILQYEVEGEDGTLFMALEEELRRGRRLRRPRASFTIDLEETQRPNLDDEDKGGGKIVRAPTNCASTLPAGNSPIHGRPLAEIASTAGFCDQAHLRER